MNLDALRCVGVLYNPGRAISHPKSLAGMALVLTPCTRRQYSAKPLDTAASLTSPSQSCKRKARHLFNSSVASFPPNSRLSK
jgi:hypothetical protein